MITINIILKFLLIIVPTLLNVATLTLLERKIMAAIQIRRGPNVIGFGILQPLADGLKLLIKELIIPLKANKFLFLFAPVLFLALSFASWSILPFEEFFVASPNLTILVFLAFSSLSVYGILLGGWASNSRYAFLGALRSASQMISYELVLSLLVLLVCILAQSFSLVDIVFSQTSIWFIIPLAPFALVYFIAILAETNRTPFDLPEAEAELVAGYSVEYSSGPFAFYFIAEYCNLIIWSYATTILFLGGWLSISLLPVHGFIIFSLKSLTILALFCTIRAALPRYRWDQLMVLAWRAFLPISLLGCFFLIFSYSLFFNIGAVTPAEAPILSFFLFTAKTSFTLSRLQKSAPARLFFTLLFFYIFLMRALFANEKFSKLYITSILPLTSMVFIWLHDQYPDRVTSWGAFYFLTVSGVHLITLDKLGSIFSTLIIQNPESILSLTFLVSLKKHPSVLVRKASFTAWSTVLIGNTAMSPAGRATIIAGAFTGGAWLTNAYFERQAVNRRADADRQTADRRAAADRQAADRKADADRQAAYHRDRMQHQFNAWKTRHETRKTQHEAWRASSHFSRGPEPVEPKEPTYKYKKF